MNLIKIILFPLCLSSIYFFFACNTPTEKKKELTLFVNEYVRYLKPNNLIQAEIKFAEGINKESAQAKELKNGVYFQKGIMSFEHVEEFSILRYKAKHNRKFAKNYTFNYKDDRGKKITHNLNMTAIEEFKMLGDASKSKGATIKWQGMKLNEHETLVLIFNDSNNKAILTDIKGATEKAEVHIAGEQLKSLANGKGNLELVKKQVMQTTKDNISTTSLIEYYSDQIDIEIVD